MENITQGNMLNSLLFILKSLSGRKRGAQPNNDNAAKDHPDFDRKKFEAGLIKSKEPMRGFLSPDGRFFRLEQ